MGMGGLYRNFGDRSVRDSNAVCPDAAAITESRRLGSPLCEFDLELPPGSLETDIEGIKETGLLGASFILEVLAKRRGGLVGFIGRPGRILCGGQQTALILLRQLGREELNRPKLVYSWQLVKHRKQFGKLHEYSLAVPERAIKPTAPG
ncbi:MAG: hypothetical protein ACHRHE_13030 [Tepidisphaerales bacterium]